MIRWIGIRQAQDRSDSKQLTRSPRALVPVAAALVSAILLAGCGGSGNSTTTSSAAITSASSGGPGITSGSTATTSGATSSLPRTTSVTGPPGALAFAECMRANGVPDFPDPQPGGGFVFPANAVPSSPAFRTAQAKCVKLISGGGPPGPGTRSHPTPQMLAHFRKVADCMRQHGVPDFPDPRTSVPPNPFGSGAGVISDIYNVIFVFPGTINQQAPAFTQAAAMCDFPLHNH